MRVYDQPPSVVTKLWEPIVLATMNVSVERGRAQVFRNVLTELFFGERRGSALLFPSVGLSELLVRPAVSRIGPECMRFSEPVRELAPGADGVRVATDSGDERYDFAIVTEPSLMGHGPSEYSPIVNAYFWLDRAVLAAPIAGFLGTTLQWAFPKPSSWASQLLALTVSAADALVSLPNEEIVARLWSDLQSSLPAARNATLRHSQIIKEKRATPVISPATQACRPEAKTSSERVFLAGDYVQNGLPSTIEGAVRNGFRAAQLLRQALDGGVGISHPS
jgi:monoamine oxidase